MASAPGRGIEDAFQSFLEGAAKLLFWLSLAATVGATGLLIFSYLRFAAAGPSPAEIKQAAGVIGIVGSFIRISAVALAISAAYTFWGEEVLGPLLLMGAAVLYFSPLWLPIIAAANDNQASALAAGGIQAGGQYLGIVALAILAIDVFQRTRNRIRYGSRADSLRYGKGVKIDDEIHNVLMGKCWQLPFCRKFVRERCPIFLARRTCWKERVGCMCEESVIQNAMQGKVISKDAIASSQYIPRNDKLPMAAKIERCRQCVIYNEHQRHKYKIALPVTLFLMVAIYFGFHGQLLTIFGGIVSQIDRVVGAATFRPGQSSAADLNTQSFSYFKELMVLCGLTIVLAYLLRLLEYLIFKLKI